jgi:hypothetical protein
MRCNGDVFFLRQGCRRRASGRKYAVDSSCTPTITSKETLSSKIFDEDIE